MITMIRVLTWHFSITNILQYSLTNPLSVKHVSSYLLIHFDNVTNDMDGAMDCSLMGNQIRVYSNLFLSQSVAECI